MLILALTILWSLAVSFACSVAESVVLSVTHAQIHALGESRAGRILKRFKREIDIPIAAIVSFHTVAHTVGASVSGAIYINVFDEGTLWVFSLVFTVLVLVFSEILPKTLGVIYVRQFAVPVAYGVTGLVFVLHPLIWVTNLFAKLLRRKGDVPITSIDEISLLARLARHEDVALGSRIASMVEGATRLRELTAYDVMVPRAQIVFLSGERTFDENLAVIRRSGHSRFPYTIDGNLDKVEGIVLVKDLLFSLGEAAGAIEFRDMLHPLLVTPASAPLEKVLRTFQEERRHLAIVVDEYGGTQGILTLEDVLEEIVGEIEDESDRVDSAIVRRGAGVYVCRGNAETRKVFILLGVTKETEMVTLAGLVAEIVGRVPRVGDVAEWENLRFTVIRASARRAEKIEVKRIAGTGREAMASQAG